MRRPRLGNAGAAAMEFAIFAPVLCLLFAGTIDLGNIVYTRMRVHDALNTGANHALVQAASATAAKGSGLAVDIARIVRNAGGEPFADASVTLNNGPTTTDTAAGKTAGGTPAEADRCYCPGVSYGATAPYTKTFTYGSAVACGAPCSDGGVKGGKFVRITASHPYTVLFAGYGIVADGVIAQTTEVQVL